MLSMADTRVPRVAVVNFSTLLGDSEVESWVPALQRQVRRDLAPAWGVDAVVVFVPKDQIQDFHWVMGIFDHSDQANALGYHDITTAGKPVMKIFVADSQQANSPVSSVASHELLETLIDPWIESIVLRDTGGGTGILYALEVADPVENDLYDIFGISVSNFVTPAWFGDPLPPGGKYDFLGNVGSPFSLAPGGYMSFVVIARNKGLGSWQQQFADKRAQELAQLSRGTKRRVSGFRKRVSL